MGKIILPVEWQAVAHSCHSAALFIEQRELIFAETIEQLMPVFVCDWVMHHKFRPGGFTNIAGAISIVRKVVRGNDLKTICIHVNYFTFLRFYATKTH